MQLLNECSSEDERLTRKLLLLDCYNEGTEFKSLPSMTIAAQTENDEFIAHSTCQNILDLEWEGALHIAEDGRVLVGKYFHCAYHAKTYGFAVAKLSNILAVTHFLVLEQCFK